MLGGIAGAGVGLSDTRNPYTSYHTVGRPQFNTTDAMSKLYKANGQDNAHGAGKTDENGHKSLGKFKDGFEKEECQTCENRRYQDESNDNGVSFQSPTKLSKGEAAAAVKGHEMEHVNRNKAKAEREGKEIVSQTVTIKTGICPECGEQYVAGGETRTTIRGKYDVGKPEGDVAQKGLKFDSVA